MVIKREKYPDEGNGHSHYLDKRSHIESRHPKESKESLSPVDQSPQEPCSYCSNFEENSPYEQILPTEYVGEDQTEEKT